MPAKLTITINKIQTVPNPTNAEIIGQFHDYMKDSDVSDSITTEDMKLRTLKEKYEQDMKSMRKEMENKFQQILAKIDIAKLT